VRAWGKNRVGVVTTDPVEWDPQPTDAAAVEITRFFFVYRFRDGEVESEGEPGGDAV
jgi:hypothetical protein